VEESKVDKRIIFVFIFLVTLFAVVTIKAFLIQVVNSGKLSAIAENQIFRVKEVYPYRKNIYDRNGEPLAINIKTYSLFTMPQTDGMTSVSYRKLSEIVPELSYSKIQRVVKGRSRYTWLARKIRLTDDQAKKIKELKGIYAEEVPKRIYPNNELLAQTLGFVGVDNKGLAGVEYQFDKELRGEPKIIKYLQDAKGRAVSFESEKAEGDPKDIYLSIDKGLQAVAEKYLKEAVLEHNALGGGIGVMDSTNGEVLAIANYPTFNPNEVTKETIGNRKLSFISSPIEPGSVFKVLTVAAALEHKVATPETTYYCEKGRLVVDDHVIKEAETHEVFEWLTVKEILKYSSNIGSTKIAFDLTFPRLKESLEKFRVGKKTKIEIPGESRGIFVDKENVPALTLSNISFGQGVATTGIQLLAAYAAIANGGTYYQPTIIKQLAPPTGERVVSEKNARALTDMMRDVVIDGTGKSAKIAYFDIAGKTGTAQRPDSLGGYSGYVPSFIGYPINIDNRFVVYVYIDKPQGQAYYGNIVAGPVFKHVAQHLLYKDEHLRQVKVVEDKDKSDVIQERKAASVREAVLGVVPNFVGLDKMSAESLAKQSEISVLHKGMGVVVEQGVPEGQKYLAGHIIVLRYRPPIYE